VQRQALGLLAAPAGYGPPAAFSIGSRFFSFSDGASPKSQGALLGKGRFVNEWPRAAFLIVSARVPGSG
jgi:hypothetical protein